MDVQTEMKSFSNRIQKLWEAFQVMKKTGIDESVLEAYLCHNLKIGKQDARKYIRCHEDFYNKILKGYIAKSLTKDTINENQKV